MPANIEDFTKYLRGTQRGCGGIKHLEYIPPEEADYRDFESLLSAPLSSALRRMGIEKLYSHQAEGVGLVKEGENVLVATPTASGKTLVYNLPVFEAVLQDPSVRALYVFPTKALTQDQLKTVREFGLEFEKGSVRAEIYDGDTPAPARMKIKRSPPNILLTNPDMLHLGILAYHSSWEKFFSNLRFVVLDELHTYRGIFGCHVSHILRRLRRICKYYGSNPQFIASSATISNGEEFTRKLTGLDFRVIEKSGSPKGPRYFMFWNPGKRSPYGDAAFLLNESVTSGLKVIVFTRARKITELIANWALEGNPSLTGRLSSYRAGYLPEERREIERKLFSGKLDAVISTSALELGIDVGGLDCCILVGYPGSIISTWQRGGRAGRGESSSLIVLIGLADALDRYFLRHPGDFLARGFESVTIDEHNFPVSVEQLACAAAELPLSAKDEEFYEGIEKILPRVSGEGKILQGKDGKKWFCPAKYPQRRVSIRSMSESYAIIDAEREAVMGDISSSRVFHECHPGAIYLHRGEEYEVIKLDIENRNVYVRKAFLDYYTQVTSFETTNVLKINSTKKLGSFLISWGEVEVKTQAASYEKRRVSGGGLISEHSLNLPAETFVTTSVWMELPERSFRIPDLQGGLHAVEHAGIALFPLFAMCDRWDVGGTSSPFHPQMPGPVIFIYDAYPGGVGLAERAYGKIDELLKAALKLIEECPCEEGCPSCIQSPKCGSRNQPLSKETAILLLKDVFKVSVESRGENTHSLAPLRGAEFTPMETGSCNGKRSRKQRIIYFDLETQRSAEEVGGWGNKHLMRVSVAVIYDVMEAGYRTFTEDRVEELVQRLRSADLIVGFNVKRFDWDVLKAYSDVDFSGLKTVDLLEEISRTLGHRLSLDHLARVTLKEGKIADGLQAIRWFREGNIEKLTEYCKHDVDITRRLHLFGKERGYVLFEHRQRGILRIPVEWE